MWTSVWVARCAHPPGPAPTWWAHSSACAHPATGYTRPPPPARCIWVQHLSLAIFKRENLYRTKWVICKNGVMRKIKIFSAWLSTYKDFKLHFASKLHLTKIYFFVKKFCKLAEKIKFKLNVIPAVRILTSAWWSRTTVRTACATTRWAAPPASARRAGSWIARTGSAWTCAREHASMTTGEMSKKMYTCEPSRVNHFY